MVVLVAPVGDTLVGRVECAVFRQEGIRACDEYQATGLPMTRDGADAWLDKLEQGQDVEQ